MLAEFHCHSFVTHMQVTTFCHIRKFHILQCHMLFILQVYYIYVCGVDHACSNTFV
jgi:hypothetical protein